MSLNFVTYQEPATDSSWPWTLLLLHGTGGSERDLIPLGRTIAPGAHVLGIRGQISERGAARFFRRFGEGQLDLVDLQQRAIDLADYLRSRNTIDKTTPEKFMIVGFSNGANMGTGLLQVAPDLFAGAILIRAMWSLSLTPSPQLHGQDILLLNGMFDQMTPTVQVAQLSDYFTACGARVQTEILRASHSLTEEDVTLAANWLNNHRA